MYDVFFISYGESNCEENWQRVLEFHSNAQRISNVEGINTAHLMCNDLSKTEKFWTIDGDNWLLHKLEIDTTNEKDVDLIQFNATDPITGEVSSVGGVKLWRKNSIINSNMSKGDFCKFATETSQLIPITFSEHRYNATPEETWKHSFRHMVKCFSGIIIKDVLQRNIDLMEKYKDLNEFRYRGYLDARDYVEECNGDFNKINLINDYNYLKEYYVRKYKD
jgi:hypothetical protein